MKEQRNRKGEKKRDVNLNFKFVIKKIFVFANLHKIYYNLHETNGCFFYELFFQLSLNESTDRDIERNMERVNIIYAIVIESNF